MTAGGSPPSERRTLYGRRRGRKLRPGRVDLLDRTLPALAVPLPEPPAMLDPADLFPKAPRAVWLEIGFGGGEHLAAQAERHPDVGIIGCEPFINGVASLLRDIDRRGLTNIRIHPGDARPVVDALPDAAIDRCFVLFPDPWPKVRHHKRRLINADSLTALARVLSDGAELRLASDDPGLVDWMLAETRRHGAFAWTAGGPQDWRRRPDDWPATRYEAKALAAGRTPAYLTFLRRPRTNGKSVAGRAEGVIVRQQNILYC
ncbi:MAG: tRNA (guanosine(46)-N7)-methyltransferase TrmB [Inquilinaceae bacterium]